MAGEDKAGLAALSRIETTLDQVGNRLESHGRDLRDLKATAHRAELAHQSGFSEVKQAIALTDQRIETHETEDDRRFQELRSRVGQPINGSRGKQIAKSGGLVVGGGGVMLVLVELIKLIGAKAG